MHVPMTDYYPLILKAVAALEYNTSAARRTVYEYARSALIRRSRNKIPPLSEAELACERRALEQAIRTVEAERGRRSSTERPPPTTERAPPDRPAPPIPAIGSRSPQN